MNYRHAFHAGNFADVVKHATLARILTHLAVKPAAFRVIDTHAGAGLYDLTGEEASRSGEWHGGIERLIAAPIAAPVRALLDPYLDAVSALNGAAALAIYPRSPAPCYGRRIASSLASLSRRPQPRSRATSPATAASRRSRSTAGLRSMPMCRRRSGAAWWWSIRRSRTPAISCGLRMGSKPPTA